MAITIQLKDVSVRMILFFLKLVYFLQCDYANGCHVACLLFQVWLVLV